MLFLETEYYVINKLRDFWREFTTPNVHMLLVAGGAV